VFTGEQENVLVYLRAMDIFLLTSLREQMPLTVLEAMAMGIPVVATEVGEIPHVIDDGINGFILDVDARVETFVRSLCALLPPTRRKSMGDAARQKVLAHFQEQVMVQGYKTVIQALS
jgi:glycosyltransferase involved in cell wall biosynthesis